MRSCLAATAALVSLVLSASEAHAGVVARAHLDGAVFFDQHVRAEPVWETAAGIGFTALLGYRFDLDRVALIPEAGAGYLWSNDRYSRKTVRVFGGGRLALPYRLEPSIVVHLGWGQASGTDDDAVLHRDGLSLATGLCLDLKLTFAWFVGVHLGYNALVAETGSGTETSHWISMGALTGIRF